MIEVVEISPCKTEEGRINLVVQEVLNDYTKEQLQLRFGEAKPKKCFLKLKKNNGFSLGKIIDQVDILTLESDSPFHESQKPINGKFYRNILVDITGKSEFEIFKNYFPVVKVPLGILDIKAGNILGTVKPNEPAKPIKPERKKFSLLMFILSVLALVTVQGDEDKFLVNSILVIISLIWITIDDKNYSKKKKVYDLLINNYNIENNNHKILLEKYDNFKSIICNPEKFETLKFELINNLLKTTKSFHTELQYKKGISENHFFQYLKKWFLNEVFDNLVMEDPEDNTYKPDFTFKSSTTNLHIDIEIDEPYIIDTLTPIHYLNKDSISVDTQRDKYFNKGNWVVIRFSEEQIIITPDECCNVIAKIIFELTQDEKYLKKFRGENIKLPQYSKIWSQEYAISFAKKKVRESYLERIGIQFNPKKAKTTILDDDGFSDLPF